jgi:hypothetical protein
MQSWRRHGAAGSSTSRALRMMRSEWRCACFHVDGWNGAACVLLCVGTGIFAECV